MLATVIETEALLKTALAALVAGVGFTASFSLAILGAGRISDFRQANRPVMVAAAVALMSFGALVSAAGIVLALIEMTTK